MLPERLEYIRRVSRRFDSGSVQFVPECQRVVSELTPNEIAELAGVWNEIIRRGDAAAWVDWLGSSPLKDRCTAWRGMFGLYLVFRELGERGIQPFSTRAITSLEPTRPPRDWSKLPPKLRYLAEPAEKYGTLQFESRMYEFLETAGAETIKELQSLSRSTGDDWDEINAWLDKYRMTEHQEARLVYFMIGLISAAWDQFDFTSN